MKAMRLAIIMIALAAINMESYAAIHLTDIRREARFLTDRMGHELGLSNRQYNDVYEINFDFLSQVNEVIDDVVYGYDDAIDYYYYLLDVRNEDLLYVLRKQQYRRFIKRDYFYRPIYMVGNTWGLRIYDRYADRNYFYFGAPIGYHTYVGAHYRIHFAHSYYAGIYTHALYHGAFRLWGGGYDHHHYDGWHCSGKHKYDRHVGSRPWSNAKNYESSRRDLKAGYVSVPSRDAAKRKVEITSEENKRMMVTTGTVSRQRMDSGNAGRTSASHRSASSVGTGVSIGSSRSNTNTSATSRGSTSTSKRSTRSTTPAVTRSSSTTSRSTSVSGNRSASSKSSSPSTSRSSGSFSRSSSSSRSGSR